MWVTGGSRRRKALAYLHGDKLMEEYSLLQGKRVLLVDDEADVLEALEELLSMCEVFKANTFEAAREYLTTQYFDLAVLDIVMPNMDGKAALIELRQIEKSAQAKSSKTKA